MNISNVKEFWKSHKEEVVAATMLVGGAILVIVGVCHSKKKIAAIRKTFANDMPIPNGLKRWKPALLWKEGDYLNGIIEEIPLSDLGKLGKQYMENGFGGPGDIATIIIGTKIKK